MACRDEEMLNQISLQRGGLLEICVLNASYDDWASTISAIVTTNYPVYLTKYDTDVPVSIQREMFTEGEDIAYTLSVEIGRQLWTTQFYSPDLIDFQGNPEPIRDSADLAEIRRFMLVLAQATKKSVRLIPESINVEEVMPYFEVGIDTPTD